MIIIRASHLFFLIIISTIYGAEKKDKQQFLQSSHDMHARVQHACRRGLHSENVAGGGGEL